MTTSDDDDAQPPVHPAITRLDAAHAEVLAAIDDPDDRLAAVRVAAEAAERYMAWGPQVVKARDNLSDELVTARELSFRGLARELRVSPRTIQTRVTSARSRKESTDG
jgi:hypothetical protein